MAFEEKRRRVYPGYAPSDSPELLAWVAERLAVPMPEWRRLLSSIKKNGQNRKNWRRKSKTDWLFCHFRTGPENWYGKKRVDPFKHLVLSETGKNTEP